MVSKVDLKPFGLRTCCRSPWPSRSSWLPSSPVASRMASRALPPRISKSERQTPKSYTSDVRNLMCLAQLAVAMHFHATIADLAFLCASACGSIGSSSLSIQSISLLGFTVVRTCQSTRWRTPHQGLQTLITMRARQLAARFCSRGHILRTLLLFSGFRRARSAILASKSSWCVGLSYNRLR